MIIIRLALAWCTVSLAVSLLVACGGGGGGTTTTTTTSTSAKTGVILDAAVAGLSYRTATKSGTTDANGTFEYAEGETVEFMLYGQVIGTINGAGVITPYSFIEADNNPNYAVNVMRLLQTLDTDGNPGNGIEMPSLSVTMNLNFNQSSANFGADATVLNFVSSNSSATLVSETDAINHFVTSIANSDVNYEINLASVGSAKGTYTTTLCNNAVNYIDYTFTTSAVTMTGDDTFNSNSDGDCTVTRTGTSETDVYTTLTNELFGCGPVCTFAELNRVITGIDADGRVFRTTISHVPNSDVIVAIKTVLTEQGAPVPYSFIEVIQFDTTGYELNLAGKSASFSIHMTPCASSVKGSGSYSFTSTGFTRNGSDSFNNCTVLPDEIYTDIYANNADYGFDCGPICSFKDLNKYAIGSTDADGRTYDLYLTHKKGSKKISIMKRITAVSGVGVTPYSFEEVITLD